MKNSIRRNVIYDNTGMGIDLGGDGVTGNDTGDADSGQNRLQNFPEIYSATVLASEITRPATRAARASPAPKTSARFRRANLEN